MAEVGDLSVTDASNTGRFPESQAPSTVNNGARALEGIIARGWKDSVEGTINSAGTEPTYTVAANRTLSAYYDGMRQGFHCHSTNASGAATLNIDAVGAKAITKFHNVALAANDLEQHGYYEVTYSASDDAFQLVTPVANAPLTSIAVNSVDGTMIAIGSDAIGDILYHDGTDYVILAAGTDGYHLRAKGAAAPVWEAVDATPRSYLAGLTLSNDTDTAHDINVTAGVCKTADGLSTMTLATEQTKQIDASWATGNDAGGFPSSLQGVGVIANTWYHVHLFTVGSTVEVGFDSSITAANLIADHGGAAGKYRRIGSVLTDGTTPGNIVQFKQVGDQFMWDVAVQEFSTDFNSTATQSTVLDVPLGLKVLALCSAYGSVDTTAGIYHTAFWDPDITDPTSADAAPTMTTVLIPGGGSGGGTQFLVRTNTSSTIEHRNSSVDMNVLVLHTYGWFDDRGRND